MNVMALRKRAYRAVTQKDMVWFDTKMGAEGTVQSADGEQGPLGAGGLMLKFTRFVILLLFLYFQLIVLQRNRRRTHRIIAGLRDVASISNDMHHLPRPRIHTFLGPNPSPFSLPSPYSHLFKPFPNLSPRIRAQ